MKPIRYFVFLLLTGMCTACTERHFISDAAYRTTVDSLFNARKQLAANREAELFGVFSQKLTVEEREAMQFLYAFMPVCDMADYDGRFYLENVRAAFKARDEMPWGKQIPEAVFRHFVLPVRVNNENMDSSRVAFYNELKARVQHLSLHDAALEINHWCHEKVTYAPSDSRTSAALTTLRTAIGRCGEESTFAVAAMRAVGIPARQVYTPRWAHTDDNHAWIEVWVDGNWHYMGACEPEPVLDLGWFSAPVQRAMLLHTKVFGKYTGPDEVMSETPCYTEINVIKNYAPTKEIKVTVVDAENKPVTGANVDFGLYNYAEFYPIARKTTNASGDAYLTVGLGDLFIRANKEALFGYQPFSVKEQDAITITLDKQEGFMAAFDMDIVPPAERAVPAKVTDEQRKQNDSLLQKEDNIRKQYESTFYTKEKAEALSAALSIDAVRTWKYMADSRGNWTEIEKFLSETPAENRAWALDLLGAVAQKDLRDTPAAIFAAHLQAALPFAKNTSDRNVFINYVLNPRVANELLSDYRGAVVNVAGEAGIQQIQANPSELPAHFNAMIRIANELNPQNIPMTVGGLLKLKVADRHSADIAVIAVYRSLGIPARIDPITHKLQYYHHSTWNDFSLAKTDVAANPPQGKVFLKFKPDDALKFPKYETHYTLSKFSNGQFTVLGLQDSDNLVNRPFGLDAGYYMLTTGRRLANGSVLSHVEFFNIEKDKTTEVPLTVRYSKEALQVIGSMNPESKFVAQGHAEPVSILQTTGRGYFVLALLDAKKEPTNHAMHDMAEVAGELEKWGRQLVFVFKNEAQLNTFDTREFKGLPKNITFGFDHNNEIANMLKQSLELTSVDLPLFVVADTFGRVVFISQGYRIGLGEQLMNVIKKL